MEKADDGSVEVERYELREAPAYRFAANRREFSQAVSAGVVIAISVSEAAAQRRGPTARRDEFLSQRFHLGADSILTLLTSKVEVGQGSRTQLAQAVAEEMNLPLDRIQLIMADTQQCPNDGGTAGSRTTPATVPRVRAAAATLQRVLIAYLAELWGVSQEQVRFADGVFRTADRHCTLGEISQDERFIEKLGQVAVPEAATVVAIEDWKVIGRPAGKVGGKDVVTGAAKFPSDIQLPNMLYGKVVRPVAYGAKLVSIDRSAADSMPEVLVVHDGDFAGCVAPTSWLASKARDALGQGCQWTTMPQPNSRQLFEHLKSTARESERGTAGAEGEISAALANSKQQMQQQYTVAYIQHAPMEPRAAVAIWEDQQLTVWTGSQQPERVQSELSQSFRLRQDQVRVIIPDTGGGFGGKHTGEVAIEAARLAKAAGKPVSLRWSREEEFTWAYFRPAGLIEVQAGLDDQGRLAAWDFLNYNSGRSAIESPYLIPTTRTRFLNCDAPLRQGSYRALASTANTFAREVAMDELAELSGADPMQFRLEHLAEGRIKDVLRKAADKFQWLARRGAPGPNRGVGLACGTEKGSFVAACAEVEVVQGDLHVIEVCQAFECGAIQNPLNLRGQHAGGLIMGLGGALYEEIDFTDGRIDNPAFSSYRVPRMSDMPKLDLVELNRVDLPSVGAGETPIIAIAPAIANAVHQATGIRCRSLPLRLPR